MHSHLIIMQLRLRGPHSYERLLQALFSDVEGGAAKVKQRQWLRFTIVFIMLLANTGVLLRPFMDQPRLG